MIDRQLLKNMTDGGYINEVIHPSGELRLFNYTPQAQYERVWNDATLTSRGLILRNDGTIAARPFRKFFNLEEHAPGEIPNEPFDVFEKLDGSLGITYWHGGFPCIATRGSFTGEQAQHANEMLHSKYLGVSLDPAYTYLFEIIYPSNRIVVDYGEREELVLLAVINTETGEEILPLPEIGFPVAKHYDGLNDLHALKALEESNREGFVVRFKSGFRVKVKFEEYVRLHRIISMMSEKYVWEHLRAGGDIDGLIGDGIPDEIHEWITETTAVLWERFGEIETECRRVFKTFPTRKETAMYFLTQTYPSVLFKLLDKKPYEDAIWKLVKPE